MDFRDYLALATSLANGATEAEWRSASSRAYYGAFHVARRLLLDLGFRVPRAERAHGYLFLRLSNAAHPDVEDAGRSLGGLRQGRNRADYDDHLAHGRATATRDVQAAERIIQALDAAAVEPVRSQITTAMCDYERNILHDVTWQPPPP